MTIEWILSASQLAKAPSKSVAASGNMVGESPLQAHAGIAAIAPANGVATEAPVDRTNAYSAFER